MRSLAEIEARWEAVQSHNASLADLRRAVRHNGSSSPCLSGFRSVCWKIFFLSENDSEVNWQQFLDEGRQRYHERREHFLKFIKHPEALAELAVDPLADDPESPWNTVREDELARAEIQQDVQRLPDEANYHDDHMQHMILDILFVYCKTNPGRGGYRQGMHELLAPIVYIVEQDAVNPAVAAEDQPLNECLLKTLDYSFVEHDAYVLFSKLMDHAQSFYEIRDVPSESGSATSTSRFPEQSSAIVERSKVIHEVYLRKVDPELAAHLTSIEILPQIFLIRWVRLLFSREFPFNQSLVLWDAIFAIDPSLEIIDLICCAMLIRIRWQLLEADYSVCLQLLLKYPHPAQPHGPHTFVDDAVYLREHLDEAGGTSLIIKYTGKKPSDATPNKNARTAAPQSGGLGSFRQGSFGARSPLRSPARFIQGQGGVETLFQGAAKGVLERGERLGINQAVRDAMGEIRRNMQGLNEARLPPQPPRDGVLTDEGAAKALAAMERRNKQLATFLSETVSNLKAVSMSNLDDKAKSLELIEIAAAKVQFVQIYLEDASMEVPTMSTPVVKAEEPIKATENPSDLPEQVSAVAIVADITSPSVVDTEPVSKENKIQTRAAPVLHPNIPNNTQNDVSGTNGLPDDTQRSKSMSTLEPRPPAPIPTRSSLAQSSFSWMLEPDESVAERTLLETGKSPPPSQKKRASTNASREKNAFLFGDVADHGAEGKDPFASGDIFGMELIPKPKGKP